jgi:hypothetical protein
VGAGVGTDTCAAGTDTDTGTDVSNHGSNKLLLLMHYYADMEVDDPAAGPMLTDGTGLTIAAAAQGTTGDGRDPRRRDPERAGGAPARHVQRGAPARHIQLHT